MAACAVTESLTQFCIAQSERFNPDDWGAQLAKNRKALALAAKYLSMTSWYGHEIELDRIVAATQVVGESSLGLYHEAQAIGFDLPYFSYTVRSGITRARMGREEARAQSLRLAGIHA
jgi:hypothetical protein